MTHDELRKFRESKSNIFGLWSDNIQRSPSQKPLYKTTTEQVRLSEEQFMRMQEILTKEQIAQLKPTELPNQAQSRNPEEEKMTTSTNGADNALNQPLLGSSKIFQ